MVNTEKMRLDAARCEQLADEQSLPPDVRKQFLDLAEQWRQLADHFDGLVQFELRQPRHTEPKVGSSS